MLQNNLQATLPNVSKEYIVSFDFKIKSLKPENAWKSIIYFTTGAGKDSPGFRHPAAFIHNIHGSLYICSQVGSSYNRCYNHHMAAPLNQWISVEVAQEMEEVSGKYMYRVKYNHEVVHKEENKNPIEVSNVNAYVTAGAPVDGWVRNLVYAGKTEIRSD